MRKLLLVLALLLAPNLVYGQATNIISSGTLPANCTVGNIYLKTGASDGFYACTATDTWFGPLIDASSVAGNQTHRVAITIDGGGSDITTGVKGYGYANFSGTITQVTTTSIDVSATACDIVIDIWFDSFANYPPTDADSITASAPPTLSSANKAQDSTLTGWTTAVTSGYYGFNVDSVTGCTKVEVALDID